MTYWQYHLIFTLPLLAILAYGLRWRITRAHMVCCSVVCVIAFVCTTPWDNYAAWLGIWGFGENVSLWWPFAAHKNTTSLIGHIPVEEYAFFIIETILACLVVLFFLPSPNKTEN